MSMWHWFDYSLHYFVVVYILGHGIQKKKLSSNNINHILLKKLRNELAFRG